MDGEIEAPAAVATAEEQSANKMDETAAAGEADASVNAAAEPAHTNTQDAASDTDAAQHDMDTWQAESILRLTGIQDDLASLRRDFESKLQYDTGKQQQLDTMHQELESYRRGLHLQLLRPIFTDLIAFYADLDKVIQRRTTESAPTDDLLRYQAQIEEILRRNGVERYDTTDDILDPKRQRVIDTVPTADPAQDKRIAERLKPGFEYEGRIVLQPEQVKTYRYTPVAPVTAVVEPVPQTGQNEQNE